MEKLWISNKFQNLKVKLVEAPVHEDGEAESVTGGGCGNIGIQAGQLQI